MLQARHSSFSASRSSASRSLQCSVRPSAQRCTPSSSRRASRLCALGPQLDDQPSSSSSSSSGSASNEQQPAPTSTKDLAKEALDMLNNDTMTTASVLGEANFANLERALGAERTKQVTGVLDPILKNRRAITLASAFLDVALIIAGIKVFQNVTGN